MTTQPPSFDPSTRAPRKRTRRHTAPRVPRQIPYTRASVAIVTVASGLLFGMSAANAYKNQGTSGELVDLVRHRHGIVDSLNEQTQQLQENLELLITEHSDVLSAPADQTDLFRIPVHGPGVSITLSDAPPGLIPENADVDDLVIHQQDIENVMNALWSGGAEAMSVQGKRITNRTVIRCIGNVIYIDGESFSPPYVISAIGDPDHLVQNVNFDLAIRNYQAYVAAYGLGWKLETHHDLELPAASADPVVQYAQPMEKNG